MREGKFIEATFTPQADGSILYGSTIEERWPQVFVTSHEFGQLPMRERFRQLAHGYIASAKSLTIEVGEHSERLDWARASAVCFCFHHAVELFLKACILFKCPDEKLGYHNIPKLTDRYYELYPFDKFFAFQNPWVENIRELAESVGGPGCLQMEDFEEKHDQVFRYLSDKEGRSPKGIHVFGPGTWLGMIEHFEADLSRIWENILEASAAK